MSACPGCVCFPVCLSLIASPVPMSPVSCNMFVKFSLMIRPPQHTYPIQVESAPWGCAVQNQLTSELLVPA